ncbi:MAG: WbqC family protein [Candidatus Methanoperedens sp.]|nr:WbqC family protein [Candidatus Methanoperedens sp.]
MKVAMMQPAFIPWQGFFELIHNSDVFIFLDDFQFSAQSYHQRNRLFVNKDRIDWYIVPVQKSISFKLPLNQTITNETTFWRKKMWKRIQQNYSGAKYYYEFAPFIEKWLSTPMESLAAQNIAFIKYVCEQLDIRPEFRLSSQYPSGSHRSVRVVELLRSCHADSYFCAKGSFLYMLEDGIFPLHDIAVFFQDFQPGSYQQIGSPGKFIQHLSIIDALMNIGAEGTAELVKKGTRKWLTWEEIIALKSH